MKPNLTTIGYWAFIGGFVLAIIAGFVDIPQLTFILFILGILVGFLNITEKESTPFLVATIALLIGGVGGLQIEKLSAVVVPILENIIAFASAGALIVALKQVVILAKPSK